MRCSTSLFLSLLLLYSLYGCSSVQVHSDFDQNADFSSINSYKWKKVNVPDDALASNPLLYRRIVSAVDVYMADRGFKKTDQGSADVFLAIHAGMKEKMRVTDWGGARGYYRDPWWGTGAYGSRVDVSYYTEGTLVIDVVDSRKNELIWRGLGSGIVHEYASQEKMTATINEYVTKILGQFPPGYKAVK